MADDTEAKEGPAGEFERRHSDKTTQGDSIDVCTGDVIDAVSDVALTGPLRFSLCRFYSSARASVRGVLGFGWATLLDARAWVDINGIGYQDQEGRNLKFQMPPGSRSWFDRTEKLYISLTGDNICFRDTQGVTTVFETGSSASKGMIREIRDRNGNTIAFSRGNSRISTITDSNGRSFRLGYDAQGFLGSISTFIEQENRDFFLRRYTVDTKGVLIRVDDEYSVPFQYVYDDCRRMVRKTDRFNYSYGYVYDRDGRIASGCGDDRMHAVSLGFFPRSNKTEAVDGSGNKTVYYYSPYRRITRIVDPMGGDIRRVYDRDGNLIREILEDGAVREYRYDSRGNLTRYQDPEGSVWEVNHDIDCVHVIDPLKNETCFRYDANRNLTSVIDAEGNTDAYQYNSRGELSEIRDRNGSAVRIHRDSIHVVRVEAAPGRITHYALDDWGRVLGITDPAGRMSRFRYDRRGRLVSATDALGNTASLTCNDAGAPILIVDALGNIREFFYGRAGLLTRLRDANGHEIRMTYNPDGTLASIINENGQVLSCAYDAAGRLVSRTDFTGHTTAFDVDPRGNITRILRPDNRVLDLTYDLAGRLAGIHGTDTLGNRETVAYEYDRAGRLVRAGNDHSWVSLVYNGLNQIIREVQDGVSIGFEHDPTGRQVSRKTPWHGVARYDYSESGSLSSLTFLGSSMIQFKPDDNGRPAWCRFPNTAVQETGFDALDHVVFRKLTVNGACVIERYYQYNANGCLSRQVIPPEYVTYHYDPENRLVQVQDQCRRPLEQFDHDPGGGVIGINPSGFGRNDNGPAAPDRTVSFKADACGNRSEKTDSAGTTCYGYSMLDQLISVTLPDGTSCRYFYDALGRRISKHKNHGTQIRYYWEGSRLLAEESNGQVMEYLFFPGSHSPLGVIKEGIPFYFCIGHDGSPQEVLDDIGSIVWTGRYNTLGRCCVSQESCLTSNIRLPGQYYDDETGFHYTLSGYYDPSTARYITGCNTGLASCILNPSLTGSRRSSWTPAQDRKHTLLMSGAVPSIPEPNLAVHAWHLAGRQTIRCPRSCRLVEQFDGMVTPPGTDAVLFMGNPDLASTLDLNTKRRVINLKWEGIPQQTELKAVFTVSGDAGEYAIIPSGIVYHDYDKGR